MEMAALPDGGEPEGAAHLADGAHAWREATPEERNNLAREPFISVVVKSKTVVAGVPRPDLRPSFREWLSTHLRMDHALAEATGFGLTHAPRPRGS